MSGEDVECPMVCSFTAGRSGPEPDTIQGARRRSTAIKNDVFMRGLPFPGDLAVSGGILPEKAPQLKSYFREGATARKKKV